MWRALCAVRTGDLQLRDGAQFADEDEKATSKVSAELYVANLETLTQDEESATKGLKRLVRRPFPRMSALDVPPVSEHVPCSLSLS